MTVDISTRREPVDTVQTYHRRPCCNGTRPTWSFTSDHILVRLICMADRRVAATTFKATCLQLLDEVAETGRPVVVTKRGRPVARVVPLEPPPSLVGSVTFLVDVDPPGWPGLVHNVGFLFGKCRRERAILPA